MTVAICVQLISIQFCTLSIACPNARDAINGPCSFRHGAIEESLDVLRAHHFSRLRSSILVSACGIVAIPELHYVMFGISSD
jgi:hypothetical protein